MGVLLEVCVDSIEDARCAVAAGVDRLELCSALSEGGLTPSVGLMEAAVPLGVPVCAMIRPRGGDFRYSDAEVAVMLRDIQAAKVAGVEAVVLGVTDGDGVLDRDVLARLIDAAAPLQVVLHRAFDLTPNPFAALETAVELGFVRILTSGQQVRAVDGAGLIAELVVRAAGRIGILPGSGIDAANAAGLVAATGVREVHASCGTARPGAGRGFDLGFDGAGGRRVTDGAKISALRVALG